MPSYTPADLALGGSRHADAMNSCPARAASVGDLRDHAGATGVAACTDPASVKAKATAINLIISSPPFVKERRSDPDALALRRHAILRFLQVPFAMTYSSGCS